MADEPRDEGPPLLEEGLRRRERVAGWAALALLGMAVLGAAGLALLAVPLVVIAFPLTLSAVAVILFIGYVRTRRARRERRPSAVARDR